MNPNPTQSALPWLTPHPVLMVGCPGMLRLLGPMLPFLFWALRLVVAPPTTAGPGTLQHPPTAARIYTLLSVLRWLIYFGHVAYTKRQASGGQHVVSDHIVLALSVGAMLQSEAVILFETALAAPNRRRGAPRGGALLWGVCLACVLTLLLLMGDMYSTARWFHHPRETAWAAAIGVAAFHMPIASYMSST